MKTVKYKAKTPLINKRGALDYAKQEAAHRFDKWNDVTGFPEKFCGYYAEIKGIVEEAAHIGFAVAHGEKLPKEGE